MSLLNIPALAKLTAPAPVAGIANEASDAPGPPGPPGPPKTCKHCGGPIVEVARGSLYCCQTCRRACLLPGDVPDGFETERFEIYCTVCGALGRTHGFLTEHADCRRTCAGQREPLFRRHEPLEPRELTAAERREAALEAILGMELNSREHSHEVGRDRDNALPTQFQDKESRRRVSPCPACREPFFVWKDAGVGSVLGSCFRCSPADVRAALQSLRDALHQTWWWRLGENLEQAGRAKQEAFEGELTDVYLPIPLIAAEHLETKITEWIGLRDEDETDSEYKKRRRDARDEILSIEHRGAGWFSDNGFGDTSISPKRRWRVWGPCPVCTVGEADDTLVLEFQRSTTIGLRCIRGCDPYSVKAAIAEGITQAEAKEAADHLDYQRSEILVDWSLDQLAPDGAVAADPVVDGVVYARNLTMAYGSRGARKTMSMIARAICVAAGIPWLGRAVKQGIAVLVLQEGDRAQLDLWVDRIARGLGVSREILRGKLLVYPADLRVDVDESWEAFRSKIAALNPRFVGLDNLTRIRAKSTGNSANDTAVNAALMDRLEKLARGGPAVELLHHANAHGDPLGSQVPGNIADLEFRIVAASADNQSTVTMRLGAKQRVGSALREIRFRFRDRADGAIVPELVEREAESTDEPSDQRQETLLALLDPPGLSAEELYDAAPWGRALTKRLRDQAESSKLIDQFGGRWRRIP